MVKFKAGDIVYHKASGQKGVISAKAAGARGWIIVWPTGKKTCHTNAELYTKKEYDMWRFKIHI
ncbi:hypothetical protein ES705_11371 [subsurface metagenome]